MNKANSDVLRPDAMPEVAPVDLDAMQIVQSLEAEVAQTFHHAEPTPVFVLRPRYTGLFYNRHAGVLYLRSAVTRLLITLAFLIVMSAIGLFVLFTARYLDNAITISIVSCIYLTVCMFLWCVRQIRRDRKLILTGQMIKATITQVVLQSGNQLVLRLHFVFSSPQSGRQIQSVQSSQRGNLSQNGLSREVDIASLPQVGTPLAVLYLSDDQFYAL